MIWVRRELKDDVIPNPLPQAEIPSTLGRCSGCSHTPGTYHNTCSVGVSLGWPENFSQWMGDKNGGLSYLQFPCFTYCLGTAVSFLAKKILARALGSHCLGQTPLQSKIQAVITKQAMHFRETAKPTPAEPSCRYGVVWDIFLQSYP